MLSKEFIEEMKARLLEAKEKLSSELSGLSSHTELGDDEDDNAREIEEDEANQDLIARINSDLAKIEKALAKIEDGSYGVGEDGREISEDRLRAIPWADKAI